jgi:hypothetical protein
MRLGWLEPTVVSQSKTGIVLQSANNQLKVPRAATRAKCQDLFVV